LNHLSSTKTNYFTCFWHFNTLNSWSVAPAIPATANLFQFDILPFFSAFNQRFLCINTLPKKKHLVTHGALLDVFLILKIESSVHFLHNLTIYILFLNRAGISLYQQNNIFCFWKNHVIVNMENPSYKNFLPIFQKIRRKPHI
jgi:hypothetical protein